MRKMTVALCEAQDAYRERLAEYIMHRRGGQLKVYTFSERQVFRERRREQPFDLVLLGTGFEKVIAKELEEGLYIHLAETPDWTEEQEPSIFKYQSGEEILRSMFACYLKLGRVDSSVSRRRKEVIGLYSPTHCRMQTPFALTMAQILALEKRVLYVNLGEWAGFGTWLQEEYRRDLSDLLYLISDYGNQVEGLLESVVHSVNRVDYIPPMTDAQLLSQTGAEDYQALLALLVERTEYDVIFLDFGIMVPGFFHLLEQCSNVYAVLDKSAMALRQRLQFETSMIKSGMEQLSGRIEYVTFSMAEEGMLEQEPVLHQWPYGILGDRARAVRCMKDGSGPEL